MAQQVLSGSEAARRDGILRESGQEHLIDYANSSATIAQQLSEIDIAQVVKHFRGMSADAAGSGNAGAESSYAPLTNVMSFLSMNDEDKGKTHLAGMTAIQEGSVCSVIMCGGQGTRLGFDGPKGCYDCGLLSGKTIFQIHVERVMRLKTIAADATIPIYFMTSDINHDETVKFFASKNFFGFPEADVMFFQQSLEPTFTIDGKIIVEAEDRLSLAPGGNGGIYKALELSGAFADMAKRGVKHVHVSSIDNILSKPCDPLFIGACLAAGAEVGNKSVWRADKSEKVGVSAQVDGRLHIVEYSELPPSMADVVDAGTGRLLFGAGNICNHYFSTAFLRDKVFSSSLPYHPAAKKIPFWDPVLRATVKPASNNGVKLETFIFDVFPLATQWLVAECSRRDEFAPVKNGPGAATDSPETARALVSEQGVRWLQAAGASVVFPDPLPAFGSVLCEVSPLLSYEGEGLAQFRGRTVTLPAYLAE